MNSKSPRGPSEAEVHGAGQPNLADQLPAGVEHLDAGERRGVDPSFAVDLESVRESRARDSEQALAGEAAAVDHVERLDVMRATDVVAARLLVGSAVGDVQDALVRGEREPVGLVERVGDDRDMFGGRVVPVHEVPDGRLRLEALEVAVARVGEPDRPVARDDHVVRRVEAQPPPAIDDGLPLARVAVESADPGVLGAGSLLADEQPAAEIWRHPVGCVGLCHHDGDIARVVQIHALDLHRGRAVGSPLGQRREVQGVLVGEVDGALVGVDLDDQRQPRAPPRRPVLELGCVLPEGGVSQCRGHAVAPRALSISHAAVISPMWLNACGKLPSSSPFTVSISSASSPRSLA